MNIRIYAALFFAFLLFILMPLYLFLENKAEKARDISHSQALMICLKKDSTKPVFFINSTEEFKPSIEPRLQHYCLPLDTENKK